MQMLCPEKKVSPEVNKVEARGVGVAPRVLESEPVHEDQEAVAYDGMVKRYQWLLNRPFVNLLAQVPLQKGRVLDIGCGPGWIPIALAQQKPDLEIWGVDPSEDMLARARVHAREAGVGDRLHFVKGSATELPFENGFFDLVSSHFVLHHIDQPELMLNESARVARGGGKIIIKDLRRQARWKTRILLAFSKLVLGYSKVQMKMYEESLSAALTMPEIKQAVARSSLSMAQIKGFRCLDFVIAS